MAEASKTYKASTTNIDKLITQASQIIIGKEEEIRLCVIAILAGGHVLLEGSPGLAKTSLVKTLAKLLGLNSNRIQFTNDLLPADILGASIYSTKKEGFSFHKGPIFANFVLADEINRASPKTQSACLQAMEEAKVNVDGEIFSLPEPFYIFATQNPTDNVGTFPLPESQLDRFLMRIEMKKPSREAEKIILKNNNKTLRIEELKPILSVEDLKNLQHAMAKIHVSDMIYDYLLDLVEKSRSFAEGLSPRASQDFLLAAKANALIDARDFVIPEDLQRVGVAIMNHRLGKAHGSDEYSGVHTAEQIIKSVAVA